MCRIVFDVKPATSADISEITDNRKRPLPESEEDNDNKFEVVDGIKLRAGKWTPEEERFTEELIKRFDNGSLSDCEDGTTLRSYLSMKLNCIPMRVSKKYGGLCIGKHPFFKSTTADDDDNVFMSRLAELCWDSIELRMNKKRRKRTVKPTPVNIKIEPQVTESSPSSNGWTSVDESNLMTSESDINSSVISKDPEDMLSLDSGELDIFSGDLSWLDHVVDDTEGNDICLDDFDWSCFSNAEIEM
jgi:hypothetical protein